ncbi:MAG TPA: aldehyde dehydrogenase family protein, partial [Pseudomonadales bacterium]|nr:aldehyde dehydrogenase family protein [Pseudomonadales bacterium]
MPLPELAAETRLFIDGELREAAHGARFDNLNPATEEVLGSAADGSAADMDAAVAAARRTFDRTDWARDHALRARCLRQLHAGLLAGKEQLRAIVVREAGSPVSLTGFMQVDNPIDMLAYWADMAERHEYERAMDDIAPLGQPVRRLLRHEPIGVVGAITPWNVPLLLNL